MKGIPLPLNIPIPNLAPAIFLGTRGLAYSQIDSKYYPDRAGVVIAFQNLQNYIASHFANHSFSMIFQAFLKDAIGLVVGMLWALFREVTGRYSGFGGETWNTRPAAPDTLWSVGSGKQSVAIMPYRILVETRSNY